MRLDDQEVLKRLFGPTTECLGAEELNSRLERRDVETQRHLSQCPHCAAEIALYREFLKLEPANAETFRIHWAENRIRMPWNRVATRRRSWKNWLFEPRVLAPAAMALAALILTVGIGVRNHSGGLARPEMTERVERSQGVELIAPKGDLAKAPEDLRWAAVAGAAQYRIRILEVDRVVLWQTSTASLAVRVPAEIQSKVLPGKRLIWQVEAFDAGGKELATGSQDFRKKPIPVH